MKTTPYRHGPHALLPLVRCMADRCGHLTLADAVVTLRDALPGLTIPSAKSAIRYAVAQRAIRAERHPVTGWGVTR